MIHREYLVLGAGIAGTSACEAIRQNDKKGSLTLVGAEEFAAYERPVLSKGFLQETHSRPQAVHEESWYAKNGVELRLNTVVRELDLERRRAVLGEGQVIEFRKACLAPGARPRRPAVAGHGLGNVFYLRSLREGMALREVLLTSGEVVVIGAGLLGVEAAASIRAIGKKVTILDRHKLLWQRKVDPATAEWLTHYFAGQKVTLLLQEDLSGLEGKTSLKNIATKSGKRFPVALALVAIGVIPNSELVANTPLSGPYGIPVDEYLETEEKGIYAAGDAAVMTDLLFRGLRRHEHWASARQQGLVAGSNMSGRRRTRFEYLPYFWSSFFDLRMEMLGDFRFLPERVEMEGDYERKKFILRYFNAGGQVAAVLCNQAPVAVERERAGLLKAVGGALVAA